ncbi:MAG: PQQ-dependent sugar dehydrogenase, partial [Myxococcales bacterium]|nr:PQQ-dependent sugar dehydrogenase [Myxococcales bacterium]
MQRRTAIVLVALAVAAAGGALAWSLTPTPLAPAPRPGGAELGLSLPPGFHVARWAEVDGARSLTLAPDGTIFVGTRGAGKVYAVVPGATPGAAPRVLTLASGLSTPNGVAVRDGALYVAEVSRILRYDGALAKVAACVAADASATRCALGKPAVVTDRLPRDGAHGWKFIAFGPDGALYVPVGAPCNVCRRKEPIYASISRLDLAKEPVTPEVFASGIRNSVGFAWHPTTSELWFTDNGRDNLGDDIPPDELDHAPRAGLDFGFPRCHGAGIPDPELGGAGACDGVTLPAVTFPAHVAALGMRFYTASMFPERYRGGVFVAQHGSWNRSTPIGYQVVFVPFGADGEPTGAVEPFLTGFR